MLSVFDHDVTVDGEVVGADFFAVFIQNVAGGHVHLVFRFDDDALAETGGFVFFHTIGDAFHNAFEADGTSVLGDDDSVEGVPLGNHVALLHAVAIGNIEL